MNNVATKGFIGMNETFESGVWKLVSERIRHEAGDKKFGFWIQPLYLIQASPDCVEIGCPNSLILDYVSKNFGAAITRAFHDVAPHCGPLKFIYAPRSTVSMPNLVEPQLPVIDPSILDRLAPGSIPPNANYMFRDFVVGKPNQAAATAAQRVADVVATGGVPAFNPLFLYGGPGLGKTHLLHSIVWEALHRNPKAKILFITAESFMRRFITALKDRDTLAFKDEMQSVDLLLIDDVQFIGNGEKAATQEEFFHRFNELVSLGKQVVLSADRSPAQLDGLAERIRTRMLHGVTLEIYSADLEMRLAIVARKLERMQTQYPNVVVPDEVRRFLAGRISSNTRELEGALLKLVYIASVHQEPITLDFARKELADLLNLCDRKLTIDEIKRTTATYFNIRLAEMDSPRRTRNLVRPRQTAMYLAKSLTARSYPEIGRRFGGRDHTTVMHAVKQIERLSAADPAFAEEVDTLRRILKDGLPIPNSRAREDGGPSS